MPRPINQKEKTRKKKMVYTRKKSSPEYIAIRKKERKTSMQGWIAEQAE